MSLASGSDLVEQALGLSQADAAIVIATEASHANLRFANNTLTTNGLSRSSEVSIAAVVGRSVGTRSATVRDRDELAELVSAAERSASEAPPAEDYAELVGGAAEAHFTEGAEHTSMQVFARLADELGAAFAAARRDRRSLFGFASHELATSWLGTSTGIRRRHVQPTGWLEVTAKNERRGGSSWWGRPSADMTDISIPVVDAELQRRLGWTERWVDLPPGRYDTVLPPSAVADFLVYAMWSADGRSAAEGRSAFSRRDGGTLVGDALGSPAMRLWSDPDDSQLAAQPFVAQTASSQLGSLFDSGLELHTTDWISGGKLAALVESRFSAGMRPGTAVTPYIDNLSFEAGGSGSIDDLVAGVERGLLLTCLWYLREVDPETLLLTGLTRDGVYLVESGEVTGVVNNFRFNESPLDLLGRVSGASASEVCLPREWSDYFQLARMPALRIPDFRMSSVSPAT